MFLIFLLAAYGVYYYLSSVKPKDKTASKKVSKSEKQKNKGKIKILKDISGLIDPFLNPYATFEGKDQLNILLLGLDCNWTDKGMMYTKNVRSDTIMLLTLRLKEKKAAFISIPRDTRVLVPEGYGWQKINAAHTVGGPTLTQKTVESLLGIKIHYYAGVKLEAFVKIIDILGGLDVDVEKDMNYDDNWGKLHIHLKKGKQHLTGIQTLGYVRYRSDAEADLGRIRRQQQVLKVLAEKLKEPTTMLKIKDIIDEILKNLNTNMTKEDIVSLLNIYKDAKPENIHTASIPTVPQDIREGSHWISYLVPEEDKLKVLINKLVWGIDTEKNSKVRVQVLNGTATVGLATQFSQFLKLRGYSIVKVTNADKSDYTVSQVLYHNGDLEMAKLIAGMISNNAQVKMEKENKEVDVTVIIGTDYRKEEK